MCGAAITTRQILHSPLGLIVGCCEQDANLPEFQHSNGGLMVMGLL